MCDYSLMAIPNRLAISGEELTASARLGSLFGGGSGNSITGTARERTSGIGGASSARRP
jgi:hypothetical protein